VDAQPAVDCQSDSPPDERGIAITRQRLVQKFGSDLRAEDFGFS
jgi:hypothetical protein